MASALGTADFSTLSNHCYRGMVFPGKSLPGLARERKGGGACCLSSGCLYSQEEGRCSSIWGRGRDGGVGCCACLAFTAVLVAT